jgi:hypothetical protein
MLPKLRKNDVFHVLGEGVKSAQLGELPRGRRVL